jgi:hypothetical protein
MTIKGHSFTQHPKEVGMTYFQHLRFALNLARLTFAAGFASLLHAIFPFLFVTTTSRITYKLHTLLKIRLPKEEMHLVGKTDKDSHPRKAQFHKTGS